MTDKPADKYDVSGNVEAQYMDAEGRVLANKLGITRLEELQIAEEEGLARAYERLISEVRVDTAMTCELIRYINASIFGDIYQWAGHWRTVQISKPGAIWPAAQFLEQSMQSFEREVLEQYPAETLDDEATFCRALAHIQGEFLAIHPFREGNARTIKLMTDLLSAQTGRPPLAYDSTDAGADSYIDAAKAALARKDYTLMEVLIRAALARAQAEPSP